MEETDLIFFQPAQPQWIELHKRITSGRSEADSVRDRVLQYTQCETLAKEVQGQQKLAAYAFMRALIVKIDIQSL